MQHNNHSHERQGMHFSSKLEQRVVFFLVTMGIVTITLGLFVLIDFVPEKPEAVATTTNTVNSVNASTTTSAVQTEEAFPIKIIFDALEKEAAVLNPSSNSVEALDEALLSGVVRHPDSADLLTKGTVFILGHSSYLPQVMNKNFQAFNGIQKLEWGDIIRLQSNDMEYVYSVEKVYEVKAANAEVPLQYEESKLVLATCNSFGTKDDRFVVEAKLVLKRAIAS